MTEIWKDITGGYEGLYQVSNLGRIRSLQRLVILKGGTNRCGYVYHNFSKNGTARSLTVHRLVAKYFIPNPENKPCVNHKNGIKADNRVENLEWCTYSENNKHALNTKLRINVFGQRNHNTKLSDREVMEIFKSDIPYKELARIYKLAVSSVCDIKNGNTWSHLTGKQKLKRR